MPILPSFNATALMSAVVSAENQRTVRLVSRSGGRAIMKCSCGFVPSALLILGGVYYRRPQYWSATKRSKTVPGTPEKRAVGSRGRGVADLVAEVGV
jgi:hypothetical protein